MLPPRILLSIALAAIVPLGACHRTSSGSRSVSSDRSVLSQAEVQDARFLTAWDAVDALRNDWMRVRGTNTITHPTEIQVYRDGVRFGTVSSLREIPVSNVLSIRHYNGMDATARWGLDHGQGVIYVTTSAGRQPAP